MIKSNVNVIVVQRNYTGWTDPEMRVFPHELRNHTLYKIFDTFKKALFYFFTLSIQ